MPYEPESSADSVRYWRKQARDESGRTVVARTLENSYVQVCVASMLCNDTYPQACLTLLCVVQEWQRSSTPSVQRNTQMAKNVKRMREASNALRRARTPGDARSTEPISDHDIIGLCKGVVADGKRNHVQNWLRTATVSEKEQFRRLLTDLKRHDSRHRYARADILDLTNEERPSTRASSRGSHYGAGNESLKYYSTLEAKVVDRLRGHYMEVMKSFKMEDPDGLGQVSKEQFKAVLAAFHVPMTPEESDIVSMLFENEVGMILYREFLEKVLPRTRNGAGGQEDFRAESTLPARALEQFSAGAFHTHISPDAILHELRTKIQHKAGHNALQTTFRRFDVDGNGSVDIGEMLEVLHSFGIHVSAHQVEKLMMLFDPDMSGSVDYIEFVKKVMLPDYTEDDQGAMVFGRGPPPPEQEDRIKPGPPGMYRKKFFVPRKTVVHPTIALDSVTVVEGMRSQLKDYIHQRFSTIRLALKAMMYCGNHKNDVNKVSLYSFRNFLKSVMVSASAQESHALFDYLDHDKDGWLDYNDLISSLGPLSKDINHVEAARMKPGSPALGNLKTRPRSSGLLPNLVPLRVSAVSRRMFT